MKTFKVIIILLAIVGSSKLIAQTNKAGNTETVKVWGNCEMCQAKIEKAAKKAGATTARWDVDSKILSVSYNTAKANIDKIEKAVAAAGYDTEHQTSTVASYDNLPGCCQYDRKVSETKKD